MICRTDQS